MGLSHVGCQQRCACELGTKTANSTQSLQRAAHHHGSIMREGMSQAVVNTNTDLGVGHLRGSTPCGILIGAAAHPYSAKEGIS